MTASMVAVGLCYLLTALGLRSAHQLGRVTLAGGGLATLGIAIFQEPVRGYSLPHAIAVATACVAMCAWPLLGGRRRDGAPLLRPRPSVSATVVVLGFVVWFALESHGGELGLAERLAATAAAFWLFPVTYTTRRAEAHERGVDGCAPRPRVIRDPANEIPRGRTDSR